MGREAKQGEAGTIRIFSMSSNNVSLDSYR